MESKSKPGAYYFASDALEEVMTAATNGLLPGEECQRQRPARSDARKKELKEITDGVRRKRIKKRWLNAWTQVFASIPGSPKLSV